jgi:hypothetical protein
MQPPLFDLPDGYEPRIEVPCRDCRVDCARERQSYAVTDEVWFRAGMSPHGGYLCIDCLERRLGRPLHWRDLAAVDHYDLDYDATDMSPMAARLAALKQETARAWGY